MNVFRSYRGRAMHSNIQQILTQCCSNIGPSSTTLVHHEANIGLTSHFCCTIHPNNWPDAGPLPVTLPNIKQTLAQCLRLQDGRRRQPSVLITLHPWSNQLYRLSHQNSTTTPFSYYACFKETKCSFPRSQTATL